jgi:antitoxin component YwqK of YwqJK toxin-antitoxin module
MHKIGLIIILIILTSCSDKENIVNNYPSGSVKEKYTLINDSIEGDYITYFESGEVQSITHYNHNVKNGLCKEFYKNGQLKKMVDMQNGLREGIYLYYDSIGNIERKGKIINDKFCSFFNVYYPNGKLKVLMLMYDDKEIYRLSYDTNGNEIHKSENYTDLVTKDTINFGEYYEAKFIIRNNNFEKIYFIEGSIDTSVYYSIKDTIKVFNQINDSVVVFRTKPLKRGVNYWTGIFYGVQEYHQPDTTLLYPGPIKEQFYVK